MSILWAAARPVQRLDSTAGGPHNAGTWPAVKDKGTMRTALVFLIALCPALGGCASSGNGEQGTHEQPTAQIPAAGRDHETVIADMAAAMDRMVAVMSLLKSPADVRTHAEGLARLSREMGELNAEAAALGEPPPDVAIRLRERYEQRIKANAARLMAVVVAMDDETRAELERLTGSGPGTPAGPSR